MVSYQHWSEAKVLRRIRLTPNHRPTGQVRHYDGDQLMPPPAELIIARHDSVIREAIAAPLRPYVTYYLFYLDAAGAEMTDWAEPTLMEVLAHAEREFGISPAEWEISDSTEDNFTQ